MTVHLRAICPDCGEPVDEAGTLCGLCANAEYDDAYPCPDCGDADCDGDCCDYYYEDDEEIEDHIVNSRGDIA